jgi:hypothetical protein
MDTFTREQFPSSLGSCALVGSGGVLKGKGIGGLIDMHDTVIRVNRVPSEAYFSDLGSKTDVFYSNSATDTYPSGELGVWITKMRKGLSVGEKLYCPFKPTAFPGNCPFAHFVVARSTKYGSDRIGDRIDMPFRIPDYLQPPFDVSHPSLALETFYWNSAPMQGYYTSGGLKAFFTVAPMCDSITLYGFAGSGNVDNHTIDTVHSFDTEHEWLHRIAAGDARDSDFRTVDAREWLFQNGLEDSVMEELPSVIKGLQDRLRCMGERGKIRIDGWTSPASEELQELVDQGAQELAESRADAGVARSPALPVPDTAWSAAGVALALLVAAVFGRRRRQAADAAASHSDSEGTTSSSLI